MHECKLIFQAHPSGPPAARHRDSTGKFQIGELQKSINSNHHLQSDELSIIFISLFLRIKIKKENKRGKRGISKPHT